MSTHELSGLQQTGRLKYVICMVIYCWSMYYVWQLKYVKMHGNIEARLVLKSCHHFIYGTQWLEKKLNVEKGKDCQRSFSTRSRAHCYNTCNFSMFRALHQQRCNPLRSKFWFAQDDASIFMPPCNIYAPHGIIWLCRQFFSAQPVLSPRQEIFNEHHSTFTHKVDSSLVKNQELYRPLWLS